MTQTTSATPAAALPRAHTQPTGTSFAGLVGVELRRLWWRRLTKAVLLGVVAFTGISVYSAYTQSTPETIAQRLDDYQTMRADFARQQADVPRMVEECTQQQALERQQSGDQSIDLGCDQIAHMQIPTLEEFGIALPFADTIMATLVPSSAFAVAFLVLLLMGSFVAAEFSTGSLGTWLTFTPQRVRVALSKLTAAAVGSALVAAVALALLSGGARLVATVNRPDSSLELPAPTPLDGSIPELLLRALAIVVGAGVLAAALGLVLRHTAALVGLLLGYLVVIEGIAVNSFLHGRLTPWVVVPNANAFLNKGQTYTAETCRTKGAETLCTFGPQQISYTHGWVYVVVLILAVSAIAVAVFRRRDIT